MGQGNMKSAIFFLNKMRPYSSTISSGLIRIIKANFTEIGYMAGTTKDLVKTAIYRVFRNITTKLLQN